MSARYTPADRARAHRAWSNGSHVTIAQLIADVRAETLQEASAICARWANECDHSDQKGASYYAAAARLLEARLLYKIRSGE